MSTLSLIDCLINTFNVALNALTNKRILHELLVNGYIRIIATTMEKIIARDIIFIIQLYCPIYQPYCQILFNVEYDRQVYMKLNDISSKQNEVIACNLNNFSWKWNDQNLYFHRGTYVLSICFSLT